MVKELRKPKFGKLLRRIRKNRGLSLRELAAQVGVDHSYLYQIETGKQAAPEGTVSIAIARALDSVELMELAEWALVRQLLLVEADRRRVYQEMSPTLRKELGISNVELQQIGDMSTSLFHRLSEAMHRREPETDWATLSPEETKAFLRKTKLGRPRKKRQNLEVDREMKRRMSKNKG